MKIQLINAFQAWAIIFDYAIQHKQCKSLLGIVYSLHIDSNSAPTRNNGLLEEISRTQFIEFFNSIIGMDDINTNIIKDKVPSGLYKKRSLLLAKLTSSEIIK